MSTLIVRDSLESLLLQARQRRFIDPSWEERFRRTQVGASLTRLRWSITAAMVISLIIWAIDDTRLGHAPEVRSFVRYFRLVVQFPLWAGLLAATWWPRAQRSLDLWAAFGVGAMIQWIVLQFLMVRIFRPDFILIGQTLPVCLLTALVLPARFRAALTLTVAQVIVAPLLIGTATGGLFLGELWPAIPTNTLIGAMIAVVVWLRERDDRRLFAQQEHLAALNAELTRLHAERGEFMAIAAHDVQAPLNAVKLTAHLALAEPQVQGPLREMLADIAGAAARMGDIVSSFLSSHAAERGDLPVQLTAEAPDECAAEALRRHAAAAAGKRQTLTLAPAAAALPAVRADAALLAQVLDNFLSNAIKFSPAGAALTLRTAPGEAPATVRFAVRDSGPGLSDADKARAFGKFARLSARPTAGEASTGLGLAVARRLAAAMHATVGVTDAPGGGAEFWIELPVATTTAA